MIWVMNICFVVAHSLLVIDESEADDCRDEQNEQKEKESNHKDAKLPHKDAKQLQRGVLISIEVKTIKKSAETQKDHK